MDIETDTSGGFGLDPRKAGVVSVAVWNGDAAVVFDSTNEAAMLTDLAAWLANPHREPGVIVTWNGACFDLPFLATRAEKLGISELTELLDMRASDLREPKYDPIGGHEGGYIARIGRHDHADVMFAYRDFSTERGIRHSLKPVASELGIEVIVEDREAIHELTRRELIAYNLSDVNATFELAARLGDELTNWCDAADWHVQVA